ncbi:YgaP family membrane protein [Haloarchaeobius amylolyticus]|uniref:YgaP family membrane protein n=1 Tax=Haloarchaeobius amylolyticus TaxID=1198296 RepID=UPI00226E7C53|nr:DUF2892 domain-containing protein [Haloarchaeobius amylolyticus]
MERNVGSTDRIVRLALGAVLLLAAIAIGAGLVSVGSGTVAIAVPLVLAVVGLVMLVTGYTQSCPAYTLIGMRTLQRR